MDSEALDKAIRAYADQHGPSGGAWNISMLLDYFSQFSRVEPRPTPADDGLVRRLRDEAERNGGQGSYAWCSRELCGKAADRIEALQAQLAESKAEVQHVREVISVAWRELHNISQRKGSGADGHIWQAHHDIAELMFKESVWMHLDDREFVPRESYEDVVKRMREAETQHHHEKHAARYHLASAEAGARLALEKAADVVTCGGQTVSDFEKIIADAIRALSPAEIAKEAGNGPI